MSGTLRISPGGPGVSMKNMLASIPFDPYNSPKSFPSGGGGGPPGPAGPPGGQGPPVPVATAGGWFPIHFWRGEYLDDYKVIVNQSTGWEHWYEFTTTEDMKIRAMMAATPDYAYAEGNDDPCRLAAIAEFWIWDPVGEGWGQEINLGRGAAYFNSDPNFSGTASIGPSEMFTPPDYDPANTPPAPVTPDDLYVVPGTYRVRFRLAIAELVWSGMENWSVLVKCAIDGALLGTYSS